MHLIFEGVREVPLDLVEDGATHYRHLVFSDGAIIEADVIQISIGLVADANGVSGVSGVVASAEHQLRAGGVDVAGARLLVEEDAVEIKALLAAVVTVNSHQVVPFVVGDGRIGSRFPEVAVSASRSVSRESNLVGNSFSELPALSAFAAFGDPWFPVAIGVFLDPCADAEFGSAAENGLSLAVVHVYVLVAVQVYGLAGARVRFGYVCGSVGGAVIVVAGGIVEVSVVEEPLAEETVARRFVETFDTLDHRKDGAVVEARSDFLVWMSTQEIVRGSPLVGKVSLHHFRL